MKLRSILLSSTLLLACSINEPDEDPTNVQPPNATPPDTNSVQGTFKSYGLDLKSAIMYPGDMYGGGKGYYLMLSDQPDICSLAKANTVARGATTLFLMLGVTNEAGVFTTELPTAAGTYTAKYMLKLPANSLVGGAWFSKYDASCVDVVADSKTYTNYASAETSSIVIEEITAGVGAKGTFTLVFGTNDRLTGRFEATACEAGMSSLAPICQ